MGRSKPGELKHLSTPRKRKQSDSLSSGERTGNSPNRPCVSERALHDRGCRGFSGRTVLLPGSDKLVSEPKAMERAARAGDSPVGEVRRAPEQYQSTAGHVQSGGKQGGPSSKAKYYSTTDSERVPRGKGEKNPGKGSEIVPETVRLQAVEALCPFRRECATAYLLHNGPASHAMSRG